jgi:hypothetical protein
MPVYITSSFVLYLSLLGGFIGPSSSLQGRSRMEFIEGGAVLSSEAFMFN